MDHREPQGRVERPPRRDLLAATFATVAVAIPLLVVAAAWESLVWQSS